MSAPITATPRSLLLSDPPTLAPTVVESHRFEGRPAGTAVLESHAFFWVRLLFPVDFPGCFFGCLRRGHVEGLVDTETLIKGLRSGVIRQAGLDVYENEAPYFFKDCSDTPVQVSYVCSHSIIGWCVVQSTTSRRCRR